MGIEAARVLQEEPEEDEEGGNNENGRRPQQRRGGGNNGEDDSLGEGLGFGDGPSSGPSRALRARPPAPAIGRRKAIGRECTGNRSGPDP